jgi:hypothetical protein
MAGKNTAAFGIYLDRGTAEAAISELLDRGFRNEDLSALMPENLGSKELASVKAAKAPEGTTAGATAGAVVGGTLGLQARIGALAIPGVAPIIAAGQIVATLAGIGSARVVGGLIGAFIGAGMPEYEAKRYEGRLKEGGIPVSVHCDNSDWTACAKQILRATGAWDVSSTGESAGDYGNSDRPMPRQTGTAPKSFEHRNWPLKLRPCLGFRPRGSPK